MLWNLNQQKEPHLNQTDEKDNVTGEDALYDFDDISAIVAADAVMDTTLGSRSQCRTIAWKNTPSMI